MRKFALSVAALVLAAVAFHGLWGGSAEDEADAKKIEMLVKELGDDQFATREAASKELEAMGDRALDTLRKAADSEDAEVRWRARILLAAPQRASLSTGLQLVLIKAGEYQMGSLETEVSRHSDEAAHMVAITKPFYIGAFEVTQEEYQEVMKAAPSSFAPKGKRGGELKGMETNRFPVEGVTWFDAIDFCNRLSVLDNFRPYYRVENAKREGDAIKSATVTILGGYGYRLPTEAEWEYACRAGTQTPYFFGASSNGAQANTKGVVISGGYGGDIRGPNLARTTKVGSYRPNAWGLYDMHGNAEEWCWDFYSKDYYAGAPKNDPPGPETGVQRALRGGSWLVIEANCRSASRIGQTPDEAKDFIGFRVARNQ